MKNEMTASEKEVFINKEVWQLYCLARRDQIRYEDHRAMSIFKHEYPQAYSHFQKVARLRNEIHKDYAAMKSVCDKIYFGTLTFNTKKNKNKEATKRKEAFKKLNTIFKYVLLVEEYGCENGRYHIHFLACFSKVKDFNSFITLWHSRQNLEECCDNNVGKYLVTYVVKDLPRLHRNTFLVALRNKVSVVKNKIFMTEAHGCPESDIDIACEKVIDFDEWVESTFVNVIAKSSKVV